MSETPRTDRFVQELEAIRIPAEGIDPRIVLALTLTLREHMLAWAEFARGLEREVLESVPKDWLDYKARTEPGAVEKIEAKLGPDGGELFMHACEQCGAMKLERLQ